MYKWRPFGGGLLGAKKTIDCRSLIRMHTCIRLKLRSGKKEATFFRLLVAKKPIGFGSIQTGINMHHHCDQDHRHLPYCWDQLLLYVQTLDTARRWNPKTHAETRFQDLSFIQTSSGRNYTKQSGMINMMLNKFHRF